jgi:hypothetical protein
MGTTNIEVGCDKLLGPEFGTRIESQGSSTRMKTPNIEVRYDRVSIPTIPNEGRNPPEFVTKRDTEYSSKM